MKFTPREIKENVNISQVSPLKEFFEILGLILAVLILIYLVLGIALDILASKMPVGFEQKIGKIFAKTSQFTKSMSPAELEAQRILDDLSQYIPEKKFSFYVRIADSPQINAIAFPGGNILVSSSLIKQVKSENELAMVLAHELGHFIARDHIRGLGRGLVLMAISTVVFGSDSSITGFLSRMMLTTERRFSRKQEANADRFALHLLYKKHGHVAGATDFFEHTQDTAGILKFFSFFSSHPSNTERIKYLNEEIKNNGYEMKKKIPLKPVLYSLRDAKFNE